MTDRLLANKYKKYNKLRAAPGNPTAISENNKRPSPIAQSTTLEQTTPKRQRLSQSLHPATLDPYDSPRSVHRTPTLHRTCIGPTPQKDGKVLGLFDLLSPARKDQATPSKKVSSEAFSHDASATPLQPLSSVDLNATLQPSLDVRISKLPMSTPKRAGRNQFLTPSVQRTAEQRTPGSRSTISKLRFDITPAFLRRDSQQGRGTTNNHESGEVDENEELSWSPVAVRRRPKPAGRGLSALVKGLRALEDEKLDEEMELLRDMEQDDIDHNQALQANVGKPAVAVKDSQVADMPLGPDGLGSSGDDDNEENLGEQKVRDGRPLKAWKKKGQKRTTRRSNMKPNTEKWKPEARWKGPADQDELTVVAETQLFEQGFLSGPTKGEEDGDDMEYLTEGEGGQHRDQGNIQTIVKHSNNSMARGDGKPAKEDAGAVRKKKMISATAHPNFRALKIKNKQSKAKGGGRYGRGRR